jgi:hypothetical protein
LWYATGPGPAPRLRLTAVRADRVREALVSTELLAVALVGVCVLSYLPGAVTWLRRLLPEQLVLLAWLGWQAFGWSPFGLVLFVTGVCARAVLLGSWLARLLRAAPRPAPTGSSFSPP